MPKVQEGGTYSKKYTEDDLQKALKAVANGVGIREAAKRYKVPRATLQFRRSHKFTKTSLGPCPYLTFEEENLLVEWLIESSKRGFPRRKYDLQLSVKSFLDKVPRDNPFKDNFPSDGWNKAFLKRHPDISIRTPEGVSSSSSKVSEKDIRKWFENIKTYLVSKGFDNILNDPSRIFNSDETGFNLCPKNSTVLAPRGSKNVYEVEHASPKQNITVLFTFSADGKVTPPMIIFPGKRLRTELYESVPETWGIGQSDTGWMKAELFNDYIVKVFHPYLISNNITVPVILFIDGHASHLTYEVSELCKTRDIILICLYPNSTRILQPADVAAFKPIKTGWKKGVLKWRREHLTKTLKKEDVAPILETVINDYAKSQTVKNGFRATGLYPFDAEAIDFTKCLGGIVNVATEELHRNNDGIADQTTITYEIFKNAVGYEKILQFVNEKPNENTSDLILFKLWKKFQEAEQNKKIEEINEQNNFENSVDQQGEKNQDAENKKKDNDDTKEKQTIEHFMPERITDQELLNQDISIMDFDDIPIIFEDVPIENVIVDDVSSFDGNEKKNENMENKENDKDYLQQILTLPKTPLRTGKRNNEKTSFVITGTVWRELKQKEEEKKFMMELEKQERKKQRLQRVNEKAEKMKEQNKKKLENLEKKKTAKVKNTKNKVSQLNKKTNQETKTRTTEAKKNNNIDDFQNNASIFPLKSIPPDNVQSASKNLFGGVRIISDYTVKKQETDKNDLDTILLELGLSQSLNVKLYSGICFTCTYNLTSLNYGIKCDSCLRAYHITCMKKRAIHKSNRSIFTCLTCLKR